MDEDNNFYQLIDYYEKNKDRPIEEWLDFDMIFEKSGKQGLLGLFKTKTKENPQVCVFKFSQYINYLVYHELTVLQGLKSISSYCPHFCRAVGIVNTKVDAKYKEHQSNPFEITNKYPVNKDILLAEFIDKSAKFYNYIRNENIEDKVIFSIVKQVLLSITIAQKHKKFTHYDLHSFNIMIKKCDPDIVFLYKIDDENQFAVPTYGYYPIIIDFGFSFIEDMLDQPLWASMAHTDVGFTSDRFDWVADPKLFLVTVSDEIKHKRPSKTASKLRNVVRNIFSPLTIDWLSGWDDVEKKGASDKILSFLENFNDISNLFNKYDIYCIDIIQSLIILPLQKQKYHNIETVYKTFLKEWYKIEREISNPFYNLYIMKNIIDVARTIRPDYMNTSTRYKSITIFRQSINDTIDSVSKFCKPKELHYEKLLCSLYLLSNCIEGYLFDIMNTLSENKQKEYDKLPLKSIEHIYCAVSANLPDNYTYTDKTRCIFVDLTTKTSFPFPIPHDELEHLNKLNSLVTGTFINDLYINQTPSIDST
jgi:hypothetical protein